MIKIYGIPNCDTVKKARAWLTDNGVEHQFHDFKKQGVPADRLDAWLSSAGWETLLNRKGTAWRQLEDGVKDAVVDAATAREVMLSHVSTIKRPVVDWTNGTTMGFKPEDWAVRASTPAK
jgi:Spx/MgsR family transcriptional regulator